MLTWKSILKIVSAEAIEFCSVDDTTEAEGRWRHRKRGRGVERKARKRRAEKNKNKEKKENIGWAQKRQLLILKQ